MLAFDGYSIVVLIRAAAFAHKATGEPVSGIDLHGGLGGKNLQVAAGNGAPQFRGRGKLSGHITVYQITVVITLAILQSGEIRMDVLTKLFGLNEVHWSSGNIGRFSKRNQRGVCGQILGGVELKLMVQNAAGALSVKVKIHVIGEIDHGGLVRFCRNDKLQGIVFSPGVVGNGFKISRKTGLSVGGKIHELHGIAFYAAVPDLFMETGRAAMQMIGAVIDRQGILHAVKGELSLGDTIGISAGNLSGAGFFFHIVLGAVEAHYNIGQLAFLVRNHY